MNGIAGTISLAWNTVPAAAFSSANWAISRAAEIAASDEVCACWMLGTDSVFRIKTTYMNPEEEEYSLSCVGLEDIEALPQVSLLLLRGP